MTAATGRASTGSVTRAICTLRVFACVRVRLTLQKPAPNRCQPVHKRADAVCVGEARTTSSLDRSVSVGFTCRKLMFSKPTANVGIITVGPLLVCPPYHHSRPQHHPAGRVRVRLADLAPAGSSPSRTRRPTPCVLSEAQDE
ncbi:hypothetical protein EVAR_17010_1 [Eumeta japonica]|uniref:Uncharacterized protein n=1 Tax=Eumeta variegata TaxID=151549 RepID=A0A4C1TVI9_EUMVA|nr:hypothetical protein EVAR_17010_1 [Eumeta japonica]